MTKENWELVDSLVSAAQQIYYSDVADEIKSSFFDATNAALKGYKLRSYHKCEWMNKKVTKMCKF